MGWSAVCDCGNTHLLFVTHLVCFEVNHEILTQICLKPYHNLVFVLNIIWPFFIQQIGCRIFVYILILHKLQCTVNKMNLQRR